MSDYFITARQREPGAARSPLTKFNWCEYLAQALRPRATPFPVYSYCNPDRDYNGETLIEFNENEYVVRTFLSGDEMREYRLVVSCRTPSYEESNRLVREAMRMIEEILRDVENVSLVWTEEGVEADVRGIVEGESFHGYAEFSIFEKKHI